DGAHACSGCSADHGALQAAAEQRAEDRASPSPDRGSFAGPDAALMPVAIIVAIAIVVAWAAIVVAPAAAVAHARVVFIGDAAVIVLAILALLIAVVLALLVAVVLALLVAVVLPVLREGGRDGQKQQRNQQDRGESHGISLRTCSWMPARPDVDGS